MSKRDPADLLRELHTAHVANEQWDATLCERRRTGGMLSRSEFRKARAAEDRFNLLLNEALEWAADEANASETPNTSPASADSAPSAFMPSPERAQP